MTPNVQTLRQTILRLDAEGKLRASNSNDSERLRYLVNYLTQEADSDRMGLLKMLRNMALSQRKVLGQPIDELKIDTENRNNFRTLLMAQPLGTATREDIDELYDAIIKNESFSA
jgi:hypothetical protein